MIVEDYELWMDKWLDKGIINAVTIDGFEEIQREVKKMASVLDKQVPIAVKYYSENRKGRDTILKLTGEIVVRQYKFKAVLTKSPQAAQKLAKECVDLDKKVQSLYEGTLRPNIKKAGQATVASANQIDASLAKIEKVIRELKYIANSMGK